MYSQQESGLWNWSSTRSIGRLAKQEGLGCDNSDEAQNQNAFSKQGQETELIFKTNINRPGIFFFFNPIYERQEQLVENEVIISVIQHWPE